MLNIDTSYRYNQVPAALHTPDSPNSGSSIFDCEHRSGSTSSVCSGNTSPAESSTFFENEEIKPSHHEYENALLKIEVAELQTRLRALQQEKEGVVYKLNKITTINAAAINNEEQIRELKREKNQLQKQNDILKKYNKHAHNKVKSMQLNMNSTRQSDQKTSLMNSTSANKRDSVLDINYVRELSNINNNRGCRGSYHLAQERYKKIQECDKRLRDPEAVCKSLSQLYGLEDSSFIEGLNVASKHSSPSEKKLQNQQEPQNQDSVSASCIAVNVKKIARVVKPQTYGDNEFKKLSSRSFEQFTIRFLPKQKALRHCIFKFEVMDQEALKNTSEVFKQCCVKYCERFGYLIEDLQFENPHGGALDLVKGYRVCDGDVIYVCHK